MEALKNIHRLMRSRGESFDAFYECFLPPLLRLCERTNRVFIAKAQDCLQAIVDADATSRFFVPFIQNDALGNASKTMRQTSLRTLVMWLQRGGSVDEPGNLESILRRACEDAASEVRDAARDLHASMVARWPHLGGKLAETLPPAALKVLNLASRPGHSRNPSIKSFLAEKKSSDDSDGYVAPAGESHSAAVGAGRVSVQGSTSKPSSAMRVPIASSAQRTVPPVRKPEFGGSAENSTNTTPSFARRVLHATSHATASTHNVPLAAPRLGQGLASRFSSHSSSAPVVVSKAVNPNAIAQWLQTGSWSEKCQALQALRESSDLATNKLLQSVITHALPDTHHRVVMEALVTLQAVHKSLTPTMFEELMARLAGISLAFAKSKPAILDSVAALRLSLRQMKGALELTNVLLACQGRPDISNRQRVVLIGWLAEELTAFGMEPDPHMTKLIASKMAIPVSDCLDGELAVAASRVYAALQKLLPEALFWGNVVPYVKSHVGRQRLHMEFAGSIPSSLMLATSSPTTAGVSSPGEPARKRTRAVDVVPRAALPDSAKGHARNQPVFQPLDEEISIKLKIHD